MRATRQTELAQHFPLHVVCEWLGNSKLVAQEHYLRVTDADFAKAIELEGGAKATRNPTLQQAELTGNNESAPEPGCENGLENSVVARYFSLLRDAGNGPGPTS